jgi:hypothetical protein
MPPHSLSISTSSTDIRTLFVILFQVNPTYIDVKTPEGKILFVWLTFRWPGESYINLMSFLGHSFASVHCSSFNTVVYSP